jgi:hypothetical protein
MDLSKALKISAVERVLDGRTEKILDPSGHRISIVSGGVAKRAILSIGVRDKCMLAFSKTTFQIAWADTHDAIEVGVNPDYDNKFKFDDWEPI